MSAQGLDGLGSIMEFLFFVPGNTQTVRNSARISKYGEEQIILRQYGTRAECKDFLV